MSIVDGRFSRGACAALVAIGLLAGIAGPADAQSTDARQDRKKPQRAASERSEQRSPPPPPYTELNASKMRVGSTEWWEQMRREGRLGGETP